MPELIALLACEKVIVDEQLKMPSLVGILEKVDVQIPEGSELPSQAIAPKEWFVFTMWAKSAGDVSGQYKQVITITPPLAPSAVRLETGFSFEGRVHKLQHKIFGLPVAIPGLCQVRIWLESNNEQVTATHAYSIEISHSFVKPDIGDPSVIETAKA